MSEMQQFSFQGEIFVAERLASGMPGAFRRIGDAPSFELSMSVEKDSQHESTSGKRQKRSEIIIGQSAMINMTLNDFNTNDLALGLYGTRAAIAAGTVSAEQFPSGLAVGDFVRTNQQNISSVVIEDSTGSPVTLTLGTHYAIHSAEHGIIEILSLNTLTQPLLADYSYAGGMNVTMFTQSPPMRWVMLKGINVADDNKPVLVELYKVKFDPMESMALINDAHSNYSMTGDVLYDSTKEANTTLGQIGRILDLSQPSS